ncbi:MAG: hypothetical protein U1D35_05825 [Paracoccaceae bacterium]|nr:hypothetical protein [Paracoccaceae bacterium]
MAAGLNAGIASCRFCAELAQHRFVPPHGAGGAGPPCALHQAGAAHWWCDTPSPCRIRRGAILGGLNVSLVRGALRPDLRRAVRDVMEPDT